MKLTDTQPVLQPAASQRPDDTIVLRLKLKSSASRKVLDANESADAASADERATLDNQADSNRHGADVFASIADPSDAVGSPGSLSLSLLGCSSPVASSTG